MRADVDLAAPPGAPWACRVEVLGSVPRQNERKIRVSGIRVSGPGPDGPEPVVASVRALRQEDYLDLFATLSRRFGTRLPAAREPVPSGARPSVIRPVLTRAVSPKILYGYGDPCVTRVDARATSPSWRLVVTSNDAPDAFPILTSEDLSSWRLTGFVFPEGRTPGWALTGEGVADFWAPELHRVRGEWWVCFSARGHDRELAIGIARSQSPDGPFETPEAPLLAEGVIDPHIVLDRDGGPILIWKADDNGIWPRRLAALLADDGGLITHLFPDEQDRRTASLAATLWPWTRHLEPMEQFFLLQPLIESASSDFCAFGERLARLARLAPSPAVQEQAAAIVATLKTRIWGQRLSADGRRLVGERVPILENDQPWEGHLIEGAWIAQNGGRSYLFYAGNDFATHRYAIGGAVAPSPLGPYRKLERPLLTSTAAWSGPGHPSVTIGPDGRPRMFLHAYAPGHMAYKAFRALLTSAVRFEGERVILDPN